MSSREQPKGAPTKGVPPLGVPTKGTPQTKVPAADPHPDSAPGSMLVRLRVAEADVNAALRNLDLTGLTWVPVELDRWKRAEAQLIAARKELTSMLGGSQGWVHKPG